MKANSSYQQIKPSIKLIDFIDSYFESKNNTNEALKRTIFPDSFFKLIVIIVDGKLANLFLTGLWFKEKEIEILPDSTVFGIKFKILAPEYIFNREIVSILQSVEFLDPTFFGIDKLEFSDLQKFVNQIEPILLKKTFDNKEIDSKKLALSKLIYSREGNILVKEIEKEIKWGRRQINRYFNKYHGISLKKYLSIQKVYAAFNPLVNKIISTPEGFHDQSHFIKEIKKHTSYTPTELEKEKDVRFVQLKNIKKV